MPSRAAVYLSGKSSAPPLAGGEWIGASPAISSDGRRPRVGFILSPPPAAGARAFLPCSWAQVHDRSRSVVSPVA